jgi:hypothetical protein
MNSSECKDRLEEILNTLLEVFDEHNVTPEDGALLSANLLFNSLSFLHEEDADDLFSKSLEHIMNMMDGLSKHAVADQQLLGPAIFRPKMNSVYSFGLKGAWGLDPVLLDEEH